VLTSAMTMTCANLVDQTVKRFGRLDIAAITLRRKELRRSRNRKTAESYAATFDSNVLVCC